MLDVHVGFGCMQELLVWFEHEGRVYAGVVFIIWQCSVLWGDVRPASFSMHVRGVPPVSRSDVGLCACELAEWLSFCVNVLDWVSFWTDCWMAFTKRGWAKRCLTSPGPLDNNVNLSQPPGETWSFTFLLLWSVCPGASLALGLFSLTRCLLLRPLLSCEELHEMVIPQIAGAGLLETRSGDAALTLDMCWYLERSGCGFPGASQLSVHFPPCSKHRCMKTQNKG